MGAVSKNSVNPDLANRIGYVVSIHTKEWETKTWVCSTEQTETVVLKTPVDSVADATIRFIGQLSEDVKDQKIQNDLVDQWLTCFKNGHAIHAEYKGKKAQNGALHMYEYLFEPWTIGEKDEFERKVGLQ